MKWVSRAFFAALVLLIVFFGYRWGALTGSAGVSDGVCRVDRLVNAVQLSGTATC